MNTSEQSDRPRPRITLGEIEQKALDFEYRTFKELLVDVRGAMMRTRRLIAASAARVCRGLPARLLPHQAGGDRSH